MKTIAFTMLCAASFAIAACGKEPPPQKPPAPKVEAAPPTTTATGVKRDDTPNVTNDSPKPLTPPAIPPTPR
jgi:predicted small lipoprotein YifL